VLASLSLFPVIYLVLVMSVGAVGAESGLVDTGVAKLAAGVSLAALTLVAVRWWSTRTWVKREEQATTIDVSWRWLPGFAASDCLGCH
jgi:hypothetical protein